MTDEINGEIAETPKNTVDNISPADFAIRRLGQPTEETQPVQEEQIQEEVPEQVEEAETEVPVAEEETEQPVAEESQDVLSQYNLDEMSEDDLRDLGEKLGSRAVARFGELTAKRKAAEEKLASLQAQMKGDALQPKQKVENNPFKEITELKDLQAKSEEVNKIIEWGEDVLFESDAYGAEDVVTEVEGKELTKAEVRKHLLQARKARDTYLPDQLNTLQTIEQGKVMRETFNAKAKEELPWMTGEDNDTRKQYEAMIKDERFAQLESQVEPDVAAQLPYLIAHAANSIYGRRLIKDNNVSINPPRTGASSAPKTSRTTKTTKALSALNNQFRSTGTKDDFIRLRTLQLTK